jgi:hypothetical protein
MSSPILYAPVYPGGLRKRVEAEGDHEASGQCHDLPVHPGGLGEDIDAEKDHEAPEQCHFFS